ncbi:MAG: efflux RND transporter periplasmic adaptor subunit [Myxococcales bacterium]|nr:efflux RND transporter periplasmic adaptor subunit [Myxococcales bacterium]
MSALRIMSMMLVAAIAVAGCKSKAGEQAEHDEHGEHGEHGEKDEHGEHGEEAPAMVELTPEQVTSAHIETAPVERRAVATEIIATGELVPPDDGVARVGAKLSGRVTRLTKGVGDQVTRGQALAIIDSPDLGRAKADYITAASAAKVTRETADREKALFERKVAAERDWRNAEAEATKARAEKEAAELLLHTLGLSDAQLDNLRADQHYASAVSVASPLAGVVVERPVALGQMVEPQDTMFVVMDLRSVWVQVDVYERNLNQIAIGQKVAASVEAWTGRTFDGTIQSIGAVLDRRSRTIKVRVVLTNADGALKPGMFAKVILAGSTGEPREGTYVPAAAVQRDGDGAIAFVPVGDTAFQLRELELGARAGDWIEVTRGLAPGERVVTTGSFLLKSEARRESFGGHEH